MKTFTSVLETVATTNQFGQIKSKLNKVSISIDEITSLDMATIEKVNGIGIKTSAVIQKALAEYNKLTMVYSADMLEDISTEGRLELSMALNGLSDALGTVKDLVSPEGDIIAHDVEIGAFLFELTQVLRNVGYSIAHAERIAKHDEGVMCSMIGKIFRNTGTATLAIECILRNEAGDYFSTEGWTDNCKSARHTGETKSKTSDEKYAGVRLRMQALMHSGYVGKLSLYTVETLDGVIDRRSSKIQYQYDCLTAKTVVGYESFGTTKPTLGVVKA